VRKQGRKKRKKRGGEKGGKGDAHYSISFIRSAECADELSAAIRRGKEEGGRGGKESEKRCLVFVR